MAEIDRVNALLLSEPQIIVSWAAAGNEPEILGDTTLIAAGPVAQRILAFGSWLEPEKAQAMERAIEALRADGEGFSMALTTLAGRPIEAEGRAVGGRAIFRLRDISGLKRELAELAAQHRKLHQDVNSLHTLINALPSPVWARAPGGELTFVNSAYARAVEASDAEDAIARGLDLLGRTARDEVELACARPVAPMAGACRRWLAASAGFSTCSMCRPGSAAPASPSTRRRCKSCVPSWRA